MNQTEHDSSGQVFTETVRPAVPSGSDWATKSLGSRMRCSSFRTGASSLFDMTVRSLANHAGQLSALHLSHVPWSLASRVWDVISKNDLDSVAAWKAFATAYPDAPAESGLKMMLQHIGDCYVPLTVYTSPLYSSTCDFLTILTLQAVVIPRGELIQQVARLTNLIVLTFGAKLSLSTNDGRDPENGIDDDIVRAWERHVVEDTERRSFANLVVLNVKMQNRMTVKSLDYLSNFPNMSLVNTVKCKFAQPETFRFKCHDRPWKAKRFAGFHEFSTWDQLFQGSLKLISSWKGLSDRKDPPCSMHELPKLHLILGRGGVIANQGSKHAGQVLSFMRTVDTGAANKERAKEGSSTPAESLGRSIKKRRADKEQDINDFFNTSHNDG